MRVCVLEEEGRVFGFLPFQFRSRLHKLLRAAEPVGEYMSGYFGMIAGPGRRIGPDELLRISNLNYLGFYYLDESQRGYGIHGERPERGLVIRIDPNLPFWEELRRRDRKFVADTERRQQQLETAHGPLRFCFNEPDPAPHLEYLIARKSEQYLRTGRPDLLATPWKSELLRILSTTREPGCQGVMSTLYAGGTWLASHFGIRNRGVLSYCFPVYNPSLSRYSPGRLLLKQILQCARQVGLTAIDRGAGDTQAKRDFANDSHLYYRGAWFRPGLSSLAYRTALSIQWRALPLYR